MWKLGGQIWSHDIKWLIWPIGSGLLWQLYGDLFCFSVETGHPALEGSPLGLYCSWGGGVISPMGTSVRRWRSRHSEQLCGSAALLFFIFGILLIDFIYRSVVNRLCSKGNFFFYPNVLPCLSRVFLSRHLPQKEDLRSLKCGNRQLPVTAFSLPSVERLRMCQ